MHLSFPIHCTITYYTLAIKQKIEIREQERLTRVQRQVDLPQRLLRGMAREEERRSQAKIIQQRKVEKAVQAQKVCTSPVTCI